MQHLEVSGAVQPI